MQTHQKPSGPTAAHDERGTVFPATQHRSHFPNMFRSPFATLQPIHRQKFVGCDLVSFAVLGDFVFSLGGVFLAFEFIHIGGAGIGAGGDALGFQEFPGEAGVAGADGG